MKVHGISFGKNVVKYDYPIREAILSVLPLCDTFTVAVGQSEDDTRAWIESTPSDNLTILDTVWDESLRHGGKVLADETNKVLKTTPPDADWIFYIQGDEVLHEQFLPVVQAAMERYKDDPEVDGLLFNYTHFYGGFNYVGSSQRWYRREIRVVKNHPDIYSHGDAQGFKKHGQGKLRVAHIPAEIYHYGWVKNPLQQQAKQQTFAALWHSGEEWEKRAKPDRNEFDYYEVDALAEFKGTHPQVMLERVTNQDWEFTYDTNRIKMSLVDRIRYMIYKTTGYIIGEYQNYKIIRRFDR